MPSDKKPERNAYSRFLESYYKCLQLVLGTLLAVMIVPVCVQIASRYTPWIPKFIWTEEIARFCFVWIVMIGSTIAVRDGTHFDVDLFAKPISLRQKGITDFVVHAAMATLAAVFLIYGFEFAEFAIGQTSEMSGIQLVWVYASFPFTGLSWLLFLSEQISDDWGRILGNEVPVATYGTAAEGTAVDTNNGDAPFDDGDTS